MREDKD